MTFMEAHEASDRTWRALESAARMVAGIGVLWAEARRDLARAGRDQKRGARWVLQSREETLERLVAEYEKADRADEEARRVARCHGFRMLAHRRLNGRPARGAA